MVFPTNNLENKGMYTYFCSYVHIFLLDLIDFY